LQHNLNIQRPASLYEAIPAANARRLVRAVGRNRLDRFHLLILDDLAYISKDQAEMSVLFELISARYERRSTLITASQPFGEPLKVPNWPSGNRAKIHGN
jgi:DNA replication protein DnaC